MAEGGMGRKNCSGCFVCMPSISSSLFPIEKIISFLASEHHVKSGFWGFGGNPNPNPNPNP